MATDKQTPTYEEAREELVEVVRRLEQGGTPLAESLALWERAESLARTCQSWLDGARTRLDASLGGTGTGTGTGTDTGAAGQEDDVADGDGEDADS